MADMNENEMCEEIDRLMVEVEDLKEEINRLKSGSFKTPIEEEGNYIGTNDYGQIAILFHSKSIYVDGQLFRIQIPERSIELTTNKIEEEESFMTLLKRYEWRKINSGALSQIKWSNILSPQNWARIPECE